MSSWMSVPGIDIVLQLHKMSSVGEAGWSVHGLSVLCFNAFWVYNYFVVSFLKVSLKLGKCYFKDLLIKCYLRTKYQACFLWNQKG